MMCVCVCREADKVAHVLGVKGLANRVVNLQRENAIWPRFRKSNTKYLIRIINNQCVPIVSE